MNFLNIAVAGIVTFIAAAASAAPNAESQCPKLPAKSALKWTYSQGPDFDVCYAKHTAGLIGVYLGFHPNFHPTAETFVRESQMDGSVIRWHRKTPKTLEFKVGLETLYELGPDQGHIWVLASDAENLDVLRLVAEGLSFKRRK
jgi:hypothetical protein